MNDRHYLKRAVEVSADSAEAGGFPVGAIVVINGEIIAEGISDGKRLRDATSHAEIAAIREASRKLDKRDLKGAVMYSSLEPCLMCFAACYWAGFSKIIYACGKDRVSKQHYEGLHNLNELNEKNNRKLIIEHLADFEQPALEIIQKWEAQVDTAQMTK